MFLHYMGYYKNQPKQQNSMFLVQSPLLENLNPGLIIFKEKVTTTDFTGEIYTLYVVKTIVSTIKMNTITSIVNISLHNLI